MELVIHHVEARGSHVRRYVLGRRDGSPLPPFSAGSHVRVGDRLASGREESRRYSLMNYGLESPTFYEISILRQDRGTFSTHAHRCWDVGTSLQVSEPANEFEMHRGAGKRFLVGGGIGVTPIVGMATQASRHGEDFEALYVCGERRSAVFEEELLRLTEGALRLCLTRDISVVAAEVGHFLAQVGPEDHVYVCGPQGLMETVHDVAAALDVHPSRVHRELFAPVTRADSSFEVVLQRSARSIRVHANQSLLDALIAEGVSIAYDCRIGSCGACLVRVVEGAIEHRDTVLMQEDRDAGNVACACVSRAQDGHLVLDL
jgi:ferredoxin-NADP reductase